MFCMIVVIMKDVDTLKTAENAMIGNEKMYAGVPD